MANNDKKNENMALSTVLRDKDESSEDNRRTRNKNNRAIRREMRLQQTLQRINQLKTENAKLEEKTKLLSKELDFLKKLYAAHFGTSQIELPKSLDLKTLLSDTTSEILENGSSKLPPPL